MNKNYSKVRIELVAGKHLQHAGEVLATCDRYASSNGNHAYSNVMYVKSIAAGKDGFMARTLCINPETKQRYTVSHWYAAGTELSAHLCAHHDGKMWQASATVCGASTSRLTIGYDPRNDLVIRETNC